MRYIAPLFLLVTFSLACTVLHHLVGLLWPPPLLMAIPCLHVAVRSTAITMQPIVGHIQFCRREVCNTVCGTVVMVLQAKRTPLEAVLHP